MKKMVKEKKYFGKLYTYMSVGQKKVGSFSTGITDGYEHVGARNCGQDRKQAPLIAELSPARYPHPFFF